MAENVDEMEFVLHGLLLASDAGDNLRRGDIGKTGCPATAAANAEPLFKGLNKTAVFMIVAVFEAAGAFGPEVVVTSNLGEVDEVAGVQGSGLVGVL